MARGRPSSRPLHPIEASALHARRERVFLILAGLFLGTLAMLNVLGVTRFIKLLEVDREGGAPLVFAVAVGVLPYPVTFLCTDFISELYGRARANAVVGVGLLLNVWVMLILWVGGALPGFEATDAAGRLLTDEAGRLPVFYEVRRLAFSAVIASMIAYLAAQFLDVFLFHFWKRLTRGRHLWLRNNGSTMVSQLVDTTAVILITWRAGGLVAVIRADEPVTPQLLLLIATGYAFKFAFAAADTIPFYAGVRLLGRYLEIDPRNEHRADEEQVMRGKP